jgi:rifampin ADP-ribosylating transferase
MSEMEFDPANHIVKLCAQGINFEGEGKTEEAPMIFQKAWDEATNHIEKFISAHYLARHQKGVVEKLNWDKIALQFALEIRDESVKSNYPSLFLNIAKCYEELKDFENAKINYQLALSFSNFLPNDSYGKMINSGIDAGMERLSKM